MTRLSAMTWMLLMGALIFCTGASVNGIRQARDWKWYGDVALANGQPVEAYYFYRKMASTFHGTPYARQAKRWTRPLNKQLLNPARSPAKDPHPWTGELVDFLTWP